MCRGTLVPSTMASWIGKAQKMTEVKFPVILVGYELKIKISL